MVFPRFEVTDTMRPWKPALAEIVPDDQDVFMYKPARWAEYGLQFYRSNRTHNLFSAEELLEVTKNGDRLLCIADAEVMLDEISQLPSIDLEVVHEIGRQTAFWVWQTK
jgi:hypothetical protein